MKCRLLVPRDVVKSRKIVAGKLVLETESVPPGTIIENPDAWRLCGIHPELILPLGGIGSDFRVLDGYVAEPADNECLAVAIAKGYVSPDFQLRGE